MARHPSDDSNSHLARQWLDHVSDLAGTVGVDSAKRVRNASGEHGVLLEWAADRRAHVTACAGDDARPPRLLAQTHFFGLSAIAPHHLAWVNTALGDAHVTWHDGAVVLEASFDPASPSHARMRGWLRRLKRRLDTVAPMLASTLDGPDAVDAVGIPPDAASCPDAVLLDSLDEADRLWTEREAGMPEPPQTPEKQAFARELRGTVNGVPRGLTRCATCGEFRGQCAHPRAPHWLVDVLCRCQNTNLCQACGTPKSRRQPMSWYYREEDGQLWYASYLAGMENFCACAEARRRQELRRGSGR